MKNFIVIKGRGTSWEFVAATGNETDAKLSVEVLREKGIESYYLNLNTVVERISSADFLPEPEWRTA